MLYSFIMSRVKYYILGQKLSMPYNAAHNFILRYPDVILAKISCLIENSGCVYDVLGTFVTQTWGPHFDPGTQVKPSGMIAPAFNPRAGKVRMRESLDHWVA